MNEANMFLHLILLIMVSLDIRQTEKNRQMHEQTQLELLRLRRRLEEIYRVEGGDPINQPPAS
jgi:hypothetical protein